MENQYLAKSGDKNHKAKTISEHVEDLLKQYDILFQQYPNSMEEVEKDLLKKAIIYHDIGKINTKFQNKLYKLLGLIPLIDKNPNLEEIPHNMLSCFFINVKEIQQQYGKEYARFLLSAIYYHHDREKKIQDINAVEEDLKSQSKFLKDFYSLKLDFIQKYPESYLLKPDKIENINLLKDKRYILLKGFLLRIDHIASIDEKNVIIEIPCLEDGKSIEQKVQDLIQEKYQNKYHEVQRFLLENQEENVVVISSTGSGKTEGVLLWLGDKKGFYTLPLMVSINAMYQRITKEIGYTKALLLHSNAYTFYQEQQKEAQNQDLNLYQCAKELAGPLTITTADQIFKIAFQYKGYEEILSVLSYSKVIIDEIQMYSPEIISYILVGLSLLTKVGGKFAIVTATFPPLLFHFMDRLQIPYKTPGRAFEGSVKKRHKIQVCLKQDIDINKIKKLAKDKKVLVIVNTVKKAQQIYEKLKEENAYLLHAQYLKKDRQKLEQAILDFAGKNSQNQSGIWISTHVVEASLDIDFDVMFTEMCSIDSLFQRMGRVYRSREYDRQEPNVYIYDTQNGVGNFIDSEIYHYSLNEIEKYRGKLLTEKDKQDMIFHIFDLEENKELKESNYYETIKKEIDMLKIAIPNEIQRSKVHQLFRNLQTVRLIPDNIYEQLERENKIEEWKSILYSNQSIAEKMKAQNEILDYTISVQYYDKIEMDREPLFNNNINIYRTRYQYEFDDKILKGRGLVREIEKNKNIW